PTIFGDKDGATSSFIISSKNPVTNTMDSLGIIESPNGTGLSFLPGFTPQINLGLFKGTEVMVRYIPNVKIGNFERTGFGVGIKHDIFQWIPVVKEMPISVCFVGTYSKSNLTMKSNILAPHVGIPNPSPADYTTQSIEFNNSGWSSGVAISKKLPVLTFFGGLHFSHSTSSIGLYGPYPILLPNSTTGAIETSNLIDPIDIESKHNQFGINGGMRIKMGIMHLTLSGCYAPGGYSSATLAWGIGWFN
ncbi:MAG: hypothetical protein H8E98_02720, partial [Bacteroidetes bacterium]|nr:hypothetical protein [Bacteroidota bacterium]